MTQAWDLLIHTEASARIGHGHLMRCLALAKGARRRHFGVAFVCRDPYTEAALRARGETPLEASAAPLARFAAFDYRAGAPAQEVAQRRANGVRVLTFDDPGPARTCADVVVDAFMTAHRRAGREHAPETRYLYGLPFAALDSRFPARRGTARPGGSLPQRLFVSFGGRDPEGVTGRYVAALHAAGYRGPAFIVCDPDPAARAEIDRLVVAWDGTEVASEVEDMATPMARSDLVATKMGLSVLEAFCLGLGCILIEPTQAHVDLYRDLAIEHDPFPALECGRAVETDILAAAEATLSWLRDPTALAEAGARGHALVDGLGVERILDVLTAAVSGGNP